MWGYGQSSWHLFTLNTNCGCIMIIFVVMPVFLIHQWCVTPLAITLSLLAVCLTVMCSQSIMQPLMDSPSCPPAVFNIEIPSVWKGEHVAPQFKGVCDHVWDYYRIRCPIICCNFFLSTPCCWLSWSQTIFFYHNSQVLDQRVWRTEVWFRHPG